MSCKAAYLWTPGIRVHTSLVLRVIIWPTMLSCYCPMYLWASAEGLAIDALSMVLNLSMIHPGLFFSSYQPGLTNLPSSSCITWPWVFVWRQVIWRQTTGRIRTSIGIHLVFRNRQPGNMKVLMRPLTNINVPFHLSASYLLYSSCFFWRSLRNKQNKLITPTCMTFLLFLIFTPIHLITTHSKALVLHKALVSVSTFGNKKWSFKVKIMK